MKTQDPWTRITKKYTGTQFDESDIEMLREAATLKRVWPLRPLHESFRRSLFNLALRLEKILENNKSLDNN